MAKDIETIIALTNALYSATSVTSQAASRKAELEAERNNVQKQSTDIWTVSSLSSYIAGEKYDDEEKQERQDLDKLEKMLSEKKNEILSLLDSKISEAESNLQSAQLAESNARYALNMALNGN
ncbi:chemotaxis protein [Streptococcus sp. CF9-1]|jgi:hypothetical protein|uniref:chemotaxis protein n=1 Tax=Streptococcus TaxID=1301 RepID=UPI0020C892B6|nr:MULTISPECIES: chemotaxis protein [unclassified Streptococcus]MCP8994685.1 chemotaxis protein [Streptococcus sp. CF9-3]MCP8998070.1 chemotaxis protein [Streptococcus sp. CF9-1]